MRPFPGRSFLVIAMYQHRHGQVLKMSINEWLNTHGEAVRDHLHHATDAASRLHAAARTAAQATATLDELGDQLAGRVQQAISRIDHAERDLRTQAAESNAAWRLIREQLSWTRPAPLTLLTIALLTSLIVSAFLAKQAFAERPGDALWAQLSDGERRDLPDFHLIGVTRCGDVLSDTRFRDQEGSLRSVADDCS